MGITPSDSAWMQTALAWAQQGADAGEVPVGAVLVHHDTLLAAAHNAPVACCDPTAHAEIRVLRAACQAIGSDRLPAGSVLYVTVEPCIMCVGALIHARVSHVIFGASQPKFGGLGGLVNVLSVSKPNHVFEHTGGVLAEQAATLLRAFFVTRRERGSGE